MHPRRGSTPHRLGFPRRDEDTRQRQQHALDARTDVRTAIKNTTVPYLPGQAGLGGNGAAGGGAYGKPAGGPATRGTTAATTRGTTGAAIEQGADRQGRLAAIDNGPASVRERA